MPMGLHRKPKIGEQRVVIMREYSVSIEFVVVSVLEPNARISPRPSWRLAANERDIGDLEDIAVAVWTKSGVVCIQRRVWRALRIEILTCHHDAVVVPIGERSQRLERIPRIGRIGTKIERTRLKCLIFVNIRATQRNPIIRSLILILRVEADVGVSIGLRVCLIYVKPV